VRLEANSLKINEYWNNENAQSMYDKNMLDLEICSIISELNKEDFVLDLGCGEGEGTVEYAKVVKDIVAIDSSETRLKLLSQRNFHLKRINVDMRSLDLVLFDKLFDVVITQRSLINLPEHSQQIDVIKQIHKVLKNKGKYIMLEGFEEGEQSINDIRVFLGLEPIKQKWHNLFFNQNELINEISDIFELKKELGFNTFYFLTRVINARLKHPDIPKWDDEFNVMAMNLEKSFPNLIGHNFSRLKMLVFEKR